MRLTGPRANTSREKSERAERGEGKKKVFNATIASSTMFLYPSQGAPAKVLFPRDFPLPFLYFSFFSRKAASRIYDLTVDRGIPEVFPFATTTKETKWPKKRPYLTLTWRTNFNGFHGNLSEIDSYNFRIFIVSANVLLCQFHWIKIWY